MRRILFNQLLSLLILTITIAPARAAGDVTVFPPSNQAACTGQTGYLGWDTASNSTSCNTGQDIFSRTLGCGANQYVAFDGAHYTCKAVPTCQGSQYLTYDGTNFECATLPSPPACSSSQFLSFNGNSYECKDTGVPTCGSNQVLTFNGANFYCVNRTDSIPACGAEQFLTYNGAGFQCASVTTPSYPTCGAGQVVTSNGRGLTCAVLPTDTTIPSCDDGEMLTFLNGKLACSSPPVANANPLYVATYTYNDPDSYNKELYYGLYTIGQGGAVADSIWAACQITDQADDPGIGTRANSTPCIANLCAGHFHKYPLLAQSVGWCAAGDINPACSSPNAHMLIEISCQYSGL